jgi:hypothetical protein
MTYTTTATLAGLALAAGTAFVVRGSAGVGVLAGFLAGASAAGLCVLLQRKVAEKKPQFLVQAVLAGFLIKAFAMLATTLIVHYVEPIARACDVLAYLIAFAVTAIGILVPATLDTLRWIGAARTATPTSRATAGYEGGRAS